MDLHRWLDAIDEPVVALDPALCFASINRAAAALIGYEAEEILGKPSSEVFPQGLCERGRCDPDPKAITRCEANLKRKDGVQLSVPISRSYFDLGEHEAWTLYTIHPDSPARVETDPNRLARRQQSILDSLEEGVVTIDDHWRVTGLNAAATKILGTPEHVAMGVLCSHVLRSEACQDNCPLARALEQRNSVRNERVHLTRDDGQPVAVSLNCAVLRDSEGEARGGVLSFRELAEPRAVRSKLTGDGFHGMIGRSTAMRRVFRLIEDVADSPSTVLITGESGVGKELVANAIQEESARRNAPYVKTNCAVFSEGILESELFGHVKGSFTDARRDHRGRFELADGGTLFLDEIAEISPHIQVKLLRVLQDRAFERVGGETTLTVDIRLIAATNHDLEDMVREGGFREDLFYRLNVIPLRVPPLRERPEDIPLLVDHFVHKYAHLTKKPIRYVDDVAMSRLQCHRWPGNVRQLENAIEFAFARARGDVLTADLFPPAVQQPGTGSAMSSQSPSAPASGNGQAPGIEEGRSGTLYSEAPDLAPSTGPNADEVSRILGALERNRWHHARAAEELGISRTTLWRRVRKLGIETETSPVREGR